MFQRTKKFFKRSIETFKSYFSDGYQKLPKTPSYNANFSLENIYSDFVDQWEVADRFMAITYDKNTDDLKHKKPSMLISHREVDKRKQQKHKETSSREREEKRCLVTRRLKEMEVLDGSNVDHVVDIQEVLHYYSRLTCPAYRELVEKFFMDIYTEFFNLSRLDNSKLRRMQV